MNKKKKGKSNVTVAQNLKRSAPLYLLMLPSIIIFLLFTYYPMYGVVIAFKNFSPADGILGSSWAGLKYFKQFFNSYQFWPTIRNTLVISLYTILVTFPLP
ncbi:MAG: sugar ABC transporter permease, partial [Lachnospiraceae bacterium]|nr:sugar ABC transporter permease [Lachnospiraceae bacterium]